MQRLLRLSLGFWGFLLRFGTVLLVMFFLVIIIVSDLGKTFVIKTSPTDNAKRVDIGDRDSWKSHNFWSVKNTTKSLGVCPGIKTFRMTCLDNPK